MNGLVEERFGDEDAGGLYTEIVSILKSIQHLDRFMSREVHLKNRTQ